jgi:RHS repeat-associated protein
MPVAAVINGQIYAMHGDHLNTPRRLTNNRGQPVWQWAYSAFGDEKPTLAKYRFANLDINSNPGMTGIAETVLNLRWPGQYHDKESGQFHNYFRSYSSSTGRYTQPDPMGLAGGWNGFAYAELNPLLFTDPLGLVASSDPWFGYGKDQGFKDWWHKQKPYYGGVDIPNKQVCDALYQDYKESGERGKGSKSGRGGKNRGDKRPNVNELIRSGGRGGYGSGGQE